MRKPYKIPAALLTARPEDPALRRLAHGVEIFGASNRQNAALEKIVSDKICIIGYADERGVLANGGRPGARRGPQSFREIFYKMPALSNSRATHPVLCDLGDFSDAPSKALQKTHDQVRDFLAPVRARCKKIISIGGGHDWAAVDGDYADAVILHIDTHLDVRPPLKKDLPHSGMPFRYLAERGAQIYSLGAQREHNAESHWAWATKNFTALWSLDEVLANSATIYAEVRRIFENQPARKKIYVSMDMDAFAQAVSPGVSAPSARGMDGEFVTKILRNFKDRISIAGFYEISPPWDRDHQTARLAAYLAYQLL